MLTLQNAIPDALLWNPETAHLWVIEAVTGDGEVDAHKVAQMNRLGYFFNGSGPNRVFAMVGKTSAPEDVTLAANRLAAYLGEASSDTAIPGVTGGRNKIGDVAWSVERSANWLADAMRKSGAADLLRRYRKPPGSDYDIL